MATYCYTNGTETLTKSFPMGKAPRSVTVKRKKYHRDIPAEHRGPIRGAGAWPMNTSMIGCQPKEVVGLREHLRSRGVQGVEVTAGGDLKIDSRGSYKAYCEATEQIMMNGGYGDATQHVDMGDY